MALTWFARQAKRPYRLCVKMSAVAIAGLCFIFVWSMFSSFSSVTSQRSTFGNISEPTWSNKRASGSESRSINKKPEKSESSKDPKRVKNESDLQKIDRSVTLSANEHKSKNKGKKKVEHKRGESDKLRLPEEALRDNHDSNKSEDEDSGKEMESDEEEEVVVDDKEEELNNEGEANEETEGDVELAESMDEGKEVTGGSKNRWKKNEMKGPLFDPEAHYSWRLCSTRSKHNYIPCIDFESKAGRMHSYRHRERSCPRAPLQCLVPLPLDGYGSPVRWPESKMKILYKNVAHPKLAVYIKKHSWITESGEYLAFPQNQSEIGGGVLHYLESIEEMVPDIEWGKNIRVVLDIGCSDSSFGAALLDKDVITLSLGLKDDLVDLAQVSLERGFPAVVSPFGTRRLPYPSGVFDAINCGSCGTDWHSNGGKLLIEMNRILRPGGYFILSMPTKSVNIEDEEDIIKLTASICWNILADKADEVSEVGVKIYQKPEFNDIYKLRRKKNPPMCKETADPDATWYVPMTSCLHPIPSAIEQHGTEWPEEWPKRVQTFPEWISDKEKVIGDTKHWKSIVSKTYLTGIGIDWSNIRNVMDMKAIYGGFAAALLEQKIWVMNVVPVHAPDTLPIIFERGLIGIYHDWCESFGTYPRSYDLLHADHLFSRLKNSCRHPLSIVIEMDRILRPGGWAIIRDKLEILEPLEKILRSLHWVIRMTYGQDKEGIICVQKNLWRP